jgi:tetratricopeptide (TPR) repeat protein
MECPQCHAPAAEDARLCAQCGHDFDATVGSEPEVPAEPMDLPSEPGSPAPVIDPQTAPLSRRAPFLAWDHALAAIPLLLALVALFMGLGVGGLAMLMRRDWADGALAAAITALVAGMAALIAGVVLVILRRHEWRRPGAQWGSLGLAAVLLVTLLVASIGALANQPALHRAQAQYYEARHTWPAALYEYHRAGDTRPHASNMARVDLKWGEELLSRSRYDDAVGAFDEAMLDDTSAAVFEQAQRALYRTYSAWLAAKPPGITLPVIGNFFERYVDFPFCDAACKTATRPLAASALYQSGPFIWHTYECEEAVGIYQRVASQYGDTPGGKQAAADLAAPVDFVATVTHLPNPAGIRAWLSKKVAPETHDYITSFSQEYQATLDGNGAVTFHGVAPGKYNFSIVLRNGYHTYFRYTNPFNPYTATVSPLCGASETFDNTP